MQCSYIFFLYLFYGQRYKKEENYMSKYGNNRTDNSRGFGKPNSSV
jgi:hypothetical protein